MKFIEVMAIPETSKYRRKRGEMQIELKRFMKKHIKMAKVVYGAEDYNGPVSCCNSYRAACRRGAFPVDVLMRNGEVYLIRRDM